MGNGGRASQEFAIVPRAVGFGRGILQVPPLRCAPVGMTKVEGGVYLCIGYGGWEAPQGIRGTSCAVGFGRGALQVPPLRCAPVGMTKVEGGALASASVTGDGKRGKAFAVLPAQLGSVEAHCRSLGCAPTAGRGRRDDKSGGWRLPLRRLWGMGSAAGRPKRSIESHER